VAASFPFDYVLDRVTGLDPAVTDYVLGEPSKCRDLAGKFNY